jgi:hypothetical protein
MKAWRRIEKYQRRSSYLCRGRGIR